jgi:bacteriocin-like protein
MNHELNINELDAVTGGGAISDMAGVAQCIGAAMGAIAGINGILGAAIDGMPPQTCHSPTRPA